MSKDFEKIISELSDAELARLKASLLIKSPIHESSGQIANSEPRRGNTPARSALNNQIQDIAPEANHADMIVGETAENLPISSATTHIQEPTATINVTQVAHSAQHTSSRTAAKRSVESDKPKHEQEEINSVGQAPKPSVTADPTQTAQKKLTINTSTVSSTPKRALKRTLAHTNIDTPSSLLEQSEDTDKSVAKRMSGKQVNPQGKSAAMNRTVESKNSDSAKPPPTRWVSDSSLNENLQQSNKSFQEKMNSLNQEVESLTTLKMETVKILMECLSYGRSNRQILDSIQATYKESLKTLLDMLSLENNPRV